MCLIKTAVLLTTSICAYPYVLNQLKAAGENTNRLLEIPCRRTHLIHTLVQLHFLSPFWLILCQPISGRDNLLLIVRQFARLS